MKALRLTIAIGLVCGSMCGQSQTASQTSTPSVAKPGNVPKTPPAAKTTAPPTKEKIGIDRCDRQFRKVCLITLSRLRREDGPHHKGHTLIVVHKGHLIVWVADKKEDFKFSKFQRVNCKDERPIEDSKDSDPFDTTYTEDTYGKVKFATVTGEVGHCYKHVIDVDHGKEHIDPHIMIDVPDIEP